MDKAHLSWQLYVDGASRNNPGKSGAGVVLYCGKDAVLREGYFLGTRTNNQAEYIALLFGLYQASIIVPLFNKPLLVFSDSELLVHQMRGVYKVRSADLKMLYMAASGLIQDMCVEFRHIPREQNTEADVLANQGIDMHRVPSLELWTHVIPQSLGWPCPA